MIPHVSKLKNIQDLNDFSRMFTFRKDTLVQVIPTIYNATNPHYNTINDSYYILVYCENLYDDDDFSEFFYSTVGSVSNKYRIFALYMVEDGALNFVAYHNLSQNISITLNMESSHNLIFSDLNIIGVTIGTKTLTNDGDEFDFLGKFKIVLEFKENVDTSIKLCDNYNLPTAVPEQDDYVDLSGDDYLIEHGTWSYYRTTTTRRNYFDCSYSDDGFATAVVAKQYAKEPFEHIVVNPNNPKQICITNRENPANPEFIMDIITDGTTVTYNKKHISSIQLIDNFDFQIVQKGILYKCNLNWDSGIFINLEQLEDLTIYKNGKIKSHDNIIKIGNAIISEKHSCKDKQYTLINFINGEKAYEKDSNTATMHRAYNSNYANMQYCSYWADGSNRNIKLPMITAPAYYTFDKFIIVPRKSMILPIDIVEYKLENTIYNDNYNYYISARQEDSLVEIEKTSNLIITENDAQLISSSGNKDYYKMKSNISISNGADIGTVKITNNISDLFGAFKNIDLDSTHSIIAKIDAAEYIENWTNYTYEINVELQEMSDILFNEDKFISFDNTSNSYYIKLNGYIFDSLSDLKNNLFSILVTNFSADEIILSDFTGTNANYIDGLIAIQNQIDDTLNVICDENTIFTIPYNFISVVDFFNTSIDGDDNLFKIDNFITSDNTTYAENEISYKLYNLNSETAKYFTLVCDVEADYLVDSEFGATLKSGYSFKSIAQAETSYNIPNNILDIVASENNIINISPVVDSTSISLNSIDIFSDYNANLEFNQLSLSTDEMLEIKINLIDCTTSSNYNIEDIFCSFKTLDVIDLHLTDSAGYRNIIHFDYFSKNVNLINFFDVDISYKFESFGALPKRCKNLMTTWYDTTDTNPFYGSYSDNILYNVMEYNSNKYFNKCLEVSSGGFDEPTSANDPCNARIIQAYGTNQYVTNYNTDMIEVWPTKRDGHTLIYNAPYSNIKDIYNLVGDLQYDYGLCIATYGNNYQGYIYCRDAATCIPGISLKAPNYGSTYGTMNKMNVSGFNLLTFNEASYTNPTLSFVFNRNLEPRATNLEKEYMDSTNVSQTDSYSSRYASGNIDAQIEQPMLEAVNRNPDYYYDDYTHNNKVQYIHGKTHDADDENPLWNHIIDFDYELSQHEISYLSTNLESILTDIYTEKRRNGLGYIVINDVPQFEYNFRKCGTCLYDMPRTNINIKLIKKYSSVYIYINNILISEIENPTDTINVSNIINYGNSWIGDKIITVTKTSNIITKKSGFWC